MKYFLILLWRIWFYVLFLLSVIIALPILLVVISKESWYPIFYKIGRIWGKTILFGMGFYSKIIELQQTEPRESYMFIANHTSMIDIMLMLSVVKNPMVFVGKEELTKIPLFGYVFKRTSITVNRSCVNSRKEVYKAAQKRLNNGLSICIFPEGLVPEESVVLSEFKNGAFGLAQEHQIPIVPMTFYDCKKRFSYTFFSGGPGALRVKIHEFLETKGKSADDRKDLKAAAFKIIYDELTSDRNTKKEES